ncbi:MAG: hypothetical protein ABIC95_03395 [archaeon]
MNEQFYIPDTCERNNKITTNDMNQGNLRIGVNNKKYFPIEDCDIKIKIEDREISCPLRTRDHDGKPRSYTIHIGKELMETLISNNHTILTCQKIGDKKYILFK